MMKEYMCTKKVTATPMTRQEAQKLDLIRDKSTADEDGYYVRYKDGYTSWSPKEAFESGYKSTAPQTR